MDNLSFSLLELNAQVRDAIQSYLPDAYWLRAETSDVRRNQNGHCYLEFIEKDSRNQNIVARARGTIWSNIFNLLSAFFEEQTGQQFTSGLSVLVKVTIEFHEQYGYSLNVIDVDPSFTIGEIARNRQLIIAQLEADGVLNLNKEIELPELVKRIAVISSPTAAGYEDFHDQLTNNSYGFAFQCMLFPAIMQGERTQQSVIDALDSIYNHMELFDAVVIIRGGGSSSDLSSFDTYDLAANCAQFPLPIISGIGHERDVTVVDAVAHTRVKTPTAAAEFLIGRMADSVAHLTELQQRLIANSRNIVEKEKTMITSFSRIIAHSANIFLINEQSQLHHSNTLLKHGVQRLMQTEIHAISDIQQFIKMVSPENILKRGYTLTIKDGRIVKSKEDVSVNDAVETMFYDGKIESIISKI